MATFNCSGGGAKQRVYKVFTTKGMMYIALAICYVFTLHAMLHLFTDLMKSIA